MTRGQAGKRRPGHSQLVIERAREARELLEQALSALDSLRGCASDAGQTDIASVARMVSEKVTDLDAIEWLRRLETQ